MKAMKTNIENVINKRSELISKCRHKNEFSISKLKTNKTNEASIS